jgi:STE24 endopeptidase
LKRLAFILGIGAVIIVVVPVVAHASVHAPRARVEDFFSPADISRSEHYRGPAYLIAFASLALDLAVLAVLGLGVGSRRLAAWSGRVTRGRWWGQSLLLAVTVSLVPALLLLPLSIAGWRHERRFGLATNSLLAFLSDEAKAVAFSIVAAAIVALIFIAIARRLPRSWPVAVAIAGSGLTFLTIFILPLIYEPAFSSFRPVDPATRARVIDIAAREGVKVDRVLI